MAHRNSWPVYRSVGDKRAQAGKAVVAANKKGQNYSPVVIAGRAIATSFWGKAWCANLEAYSDYENRLPRGRSYVRAGSVIHLAIEPGKIIAKVAGSSVYQVEISIHAVPDERWKALLNQCTGSIASLIELLQGRLSTAVMEAVTAPKTGLFPVPKEIKLSCTCPDSAVMCKHVASVMYGVGARLDAQPELLFTLRQVDADALVTQAAASSQQAKAKSSQAKRLDVATLGNLFGLELDSSEVIATQTPIKAKRTKRT